MTTPEDRLIPTLAMPRDPRLRRLFALVGMAMADGDIYNVEDRLYDVMLDIAPEFMPPADADEDSTLWLEWHAFVVDATSPNSH